MAPQPSLAIDGPTRHPPVLKLKSGRGKLGTPEAASPFRSPKSAQPRVFARLQALFPPSFPFPQSPTVPTSPPNKDVPPFPLPPPSPQFLKARIITWNMHDSLPKGDIEELLGSIPLHTPRDILNDADRIKIPGLSMDGDHPYHIIVVAGQECPTLSGIPLGLAANFKHRDARDRDKEEKHRDVEKDGGKDKDILYQTKHLLSKHLKHEHASQTRFPDPLHGDLADTSSSHGSMPTSGWSAVLEDWFANGVGSLHDVRPVVTGTVQDPMVPASSSSPSFNGSKSVVASGHDTHQASIDYQLPETVDVDWKPNNPSETPSHVSSTFNIKSRTGPYELLVKERLMGIYTAVYIHKDVRSLVRGVSTGAVPAGLIGGRLGNKGGVGISIDLDGTTLLFINAHLAAHEGKVPLRVANLAKIKAELPLESWLDPDDPRVLAEDLTDRFDHSWIFGDLNFRLDISRLHADWLISRKEYSQAFAFDQLHKLMKGGEGAFAGFNEAEIDFPPTFKYDVMRSLKREKYKHRSHRVDPEDKDGNQVNDAIHEAGDDEDQDEVVSLHSSAWTSSHSRNHSDPTDGGNESDGSPPPSISSGGIGLIHSSSSRLVTRAALKAKATWMAILDSSRDLSPRTDSPRSRRRTSAARLGTPGSAIELSRGTQVDFETRSPVPILRRAISAKNPLGPQPPEDGHGLSENDKGIYDSSSKKRVPSWCDRILWKTTVEPPEQFPDPEPMVDQEMQTGPSSGRPSRVGQFFLQAFRPRTWRDYLGAESATEHLKPESHSGIASNSMLLPPFSGPTEPVHGTMSPGLYQSKSLEPSPSSLDDSLLASLGRNRSASASAARDRTSRRQSMPVYPRPPRPLPAPRRADSDQIPRASSENTSTSSQSPVIPAPRVTSRRWFLNLLSRDHIHSPTPLTNTPGLQLESTPPPPQRKGDVVCLSYRTLDDRQMRRLEGRSDHRPVIGSFAIYI